MDWLEALKGLLPGSTPMSGPAQPSTPPAGSDKNFSAANLVSPVQFDPSMARSQVMNDKLGQLGALLMSAGQRQTSAQRALTLTGMGEVMGNTGRDLQQAYQAQQHGIQAQQLAENQNRLAMFDQQVRSNPAMLQKLGISPEQYAAMGPQGVMKAIETNAARDPIDHAYKQALIDAQNRPQIGVIGEDDLGNKIYGDTRTGKTIAELSGGGAPANLPGAANTATAPASQGNLFDQVKGLEGEDLVKKLREINPSLASEVDSIVNGNQPIPARMLGTKRGEVISALVSQAAGQDFDPNAYQARRTMKAEFSKGSVGSLGGQRNFGNTAVKHGGELYDLIDKLDNTSGTGATLLNALSNAKSNFNQDDRSKALAQWKATAANFADEIAKFYGAGGVEERKKIEALLDPNQSPDVLRSVVKEQTKDMYQKIQNLENQRNEVMGPIQSKRIQVIFDDTKKVYDKIHGGEEGKTNNQIAPEHHAQSIENAKAAIAKDPSKRAAILKRLSDNGIPTEGL